MRSRAIEIKWAIVFVVMALIWMFLEKIFGLHSTHIDKHALYTNLIAIPAIAIYALALLDKRKNYYSRLMTFKQGFVSGLIITLIVAILSPLTQIITSKVITTGYFPNAIKHAVSSGQMEQAAAEQYFSLNNYIIMGLIGALGMGVLTSAVVAIFTRRSARNYTTVKNPVS